MVDFKTRFNKTILTGLHYSGLDRLCAPLTKGRGIIFTLHQVGDNPTHDFAPNAILKVTPEFLEQTINTVRRQNYDIISLDEMKSRLTNPEPSRPFAVFTFDDGYKDNRDIALKIFEKQNCPLAIFIVSDYSAHKGEMWWLALEDIIQNNQLIKDPFDPSSVHKAETTQQKHKTYEHIYWQLRFMDQSEQRRQVKAFAASHDYDINALTKTLILSWEELRELNQNPLVTLGAHTKSHYALGLLNKEEALKEVKAGIEVMQQELGETPKHFAYPYGDTRSATEKDFEILKDLGLETALTTSKGLIYPEHQNHLTALPRVSLNGNYQHQRYVKSFLSGLPFTLANKGRRINI